MAKKLEYQIGVDASQGISGVKDFSRTVSQELKKVEGDFDDTSSAGEKVATVLAQMATDLDSELARAAAASDALKAAMGEIGEGANMGDIISGLQRMGLTFEDIVTDADKLASAMKQLDEVQMKGLNSGLGGVNTKLGNLEKSAGGSRSVLANMVGNSVQDLGALGGLAGSAGVAIGQMGEYMADAAGEGEKLSSVIKNFGATAVPLAAIGIATKGIADHFSEIAKTKAFNKDQVDAYAQALEDTTDAAAAVSEALIGMGKVEISLDGQTHDMTPRLAELGLTIRQFSKLVAGGKPAIKAWGDTMRAAGVDGDALTEVLGTAVIQSENLADAQERAAINAKFFGDNTVKAAENVALAITTSADAAERHAAAAVKNAKDLRDEDIKRLRAMEATTAAIVEQKAEQAEATEAMLQSVGQLAEGILAYRDAMKSVDWKDTDLQGAVAGMEDFRSAHFGLAEIARDTADAEKDLGDAIKENGKHFDLTTEKGQKNLDAIRNLATSIDTHLAAAFTEADGNQKKFQKTAEGIADRTMADLRKEFDLTDDQAADLAEALGLLPEDIKTRYELAGIEEAQLKLGLLSTSIDDLPKDVKTKVTQEIIKGDYVGALEDIQDYYDQHEVELKIRPVITGVEDFLGSLGLGVGVGGTAAVPTTRMLGAAPTAMAPIPVPIAVTGTSTGQRPVVYNINQVFQTGVMGAPFDVSRAVEDANRRTLRLMPKVP